MKNNRKLRVAALFAWLGLATSLVVPATANAGATGFAITCSYNPSSGLIYLSTLSSPGGTASVAYDIFPNNGTLYAGAAFGYGKPSFAAIYSLPGQTDPIYVQAAPFNKPGNKTPHLSRYLDIVICLVI